MENQKEKFTAESFMPYLINAARNWILDGDGVPHLLLISEHLTDPVLLNASYPAVKDDPNSPKMLILNISSAAVKQFEVKDGYLSCNMRFGGVPHDVCVPVELIVTIYDRDTGRSIPCSEFEYALRWSSENLAKGPTPEPEPTPAPKKNHLRLVH